MATVLDLLDRNKRMEEVRQPWLEYWQELGELFLPNQADFTIQRNRGDERSSHIYDAHPRLSCHSLITTLDGLLKPKTAKWAWPTTFDEDLAEEDEVKLWLEELERRMMRSIYRPQAGFVKNSREADEGLVVFGQGPLYTDLNRDRNGLIFRSYHLSKVVFDENSDGVIDVVGIKECMTLRQAEGRYGIENLHPNMVKKAQEAKGSQKRFDIVQIILPRDDRDSRRIDHKGMAFASIHIDVENEHIIRESGYEEFPFAIPRWDTSPGEIYARSPAMMALPDARTLQEIQKTLLAGGHRAVDPPVWALGDSMLSPVRTFPGGVTIIDADAAASTSGAPIGVLDMGKNIPLGRDIQQAVQETVSRAFFLHVLNMPVEGRQMTATEILERKEEYIRIIGPIVGRLENDYLGRMMQRVLGIMMRHPNALPPMPEALQEAGGMSQIRFEFMSPVQRARKNTEALQFAQAMQMMQPMAAFAPEVFDNLDGDEIMRDMPEWAGIPERWIRREEDIEQRRDERKQMEQVAQAAQIAPQISSTIKDLAQAGGRGPITGGL